MRLALPHRIRTAAPVVDRQLRNRLGGGVLGPVVPRLLSCELDHLDGPAGPLGDDGILVVPEGGRHRVAAVCPRRRREDEHALEEVAVLGQQEARYLALVLCGARAPRNGPQVASGRGEAETGGRVATGLFAL